MDQATLVGPDIDAGRAALSILDSAGIKQTVAFLAMFPDYSDWRLVLSSPSLDQIHPLKAYDKVHEILQGNFVYSLPPIMILATKVPFIRWLKGVFRSQKTTVNGVIRLGEHKIGDRFASEVIVIRLPGITA